MVTKFIPLSREEEIALLRSDDKNFNATRKYLADLITSSLNHFVFSAEEQTQLYQQLLDDVPVAAERFLRNQDPANANYTFAIYFTWYISERLNKLRKLKRRTD